MNQTLSIERLKNPASEADIRALAHLLVDAVASGAAVSFLAPLPLERAADWWRETLHSSHPRAVFLVARDDRELIGTVQLQPAWEPNQPHRAHIVKLLVHQRVRRKGVASALMGEIESAAREGGFQLLTLDAKVGGGAELLYRKLGWTAAGIIPRYALEHDETMHDAEFFYKELGDSD